jgi:hypothetical protein
MSTADDNARKRRWWLPSVGLAVWLAFFLALSLSSWRLVLISADGDPCLHWRIGNWMIEHREVIRADQFSHTRFGAPLISKEWLSEIVFAAAGNSLGWNGIVLLAAALIATTLWLLHRQLLAEGNELLLSTGLVMLAALGCSTHWLARPHLITHLLTVVFAWQLNGFMHGRVSTVRLFEVLVPLSLLWANLHGAFFVGFVLIATFWSGAAIEAGRDSVHGTRAGRWMRRGQPGLRRAQSSRGLSLQTAGRLKILTIVGALCLAASLINPNGWRLHAQVLHFLRTPALATLTNEFRSPNFHSGGTTGFLLVLLALAVILLVARPRFRPTEILLVCVWGYFALHSARNVPLFALVVTPILATHLNQFLLQRQDSRSMHLYRKVSADMSDLDRSASGRIPAVFVVGLLIVAIAWPVASNSRPLITTEVLTNRFPVATVEYYLKGPEAEAALRGEMFNDYGWGGYLMLALPNRKVFIDGRNDFYGEELVREFNQVNTVKPGWENVLEKYNVGWTILPPNHLLNSLLALRTDWKLYHTDDVAAVFVRKQ